MTTRTGLTIEQFLAAEWPPDTQLIDGEVVMNDPTFRHQEIAMRIAVAFRIWISYRGGHGRAGMGCNWTVAPGQLYKPDVWWIPDGDVDRIRDAVRSDPPPAIAVEVWSPGTWRYDTGRKREVYERAAVKELWLVDTPRQVVTVLGQATFDAPVDLGEGDAITSPLLDGFSLVVDDLFTE